MWKPLAIALAPRFTVVAPDLPGIGNSSIPSKGSDMKTAAQRVRDAVHDKSLGVALGAQARLISDDVTVVVLKNTGHWLMEESPRETIASLTKFLERQ
jgi:pimeloyl-ACP methyl ester carboxylesterase